MFHTDITAVNSFISFSCISLRKITFLSFILTLQGCYVTGTYSVSEWVEKN